MPATCPAYALDCANASWPTGCEYPLRLDVADLEVLTDGVIAGGAMRICARRVVVTDGQITSSVLGHAAGFGPAEHRRAFGCVTDPPEVGKLVGAGSGAAHGGAGGRAATFMNISGCDGGRAYDDAMAPGGQVERPRAGSPRQTRSTVTNSP